MDRRKYQHLITEWQREREIDREIEREIER